MENVAFRVVDQGSSSRDGCVLTGAARLTKFRWGASRVGVVQLVRGGPGLGSPTSLFTGVFVFSLLGCSGFYWWVAVDVCLSRLFVM